MGGVSIYKNWFVLQILVQVEMKSAHGSRLAERGFWTDGPWALGGGGIRLLLMMILGWEGLACAETPLGTCAGLGKEHLW